jgi:hypothetical protein
MSDRLLVSPTTLAGVVAVAAVLGWGWWQLSLPPDATKAAGSTGLIGLGDPERSGDPVLPTLGDVDAKGGCVHLLRLPDLKAVSDKGLLDHSGFFDASPLMVFEDDQPLTPHARGSACDGGFAHSPLGAVVRSVVEGAHTWRFGLTADLVVTKRRGKAGPQQLLYVYPGTTLEVSVPAWSSAWGDPVVHLAGVASRSDTDASLALGGASVPLAGAGGAIRAKLEAEPNRSSTALRLHVPAGGPVLVVTDLVVGMGDAATAVVGTLEGATSEIVATADTEVEDAGPRGAVSRAGRPPASVLTLPDEIADPCSVVIKTPELAALSDLRLFERYGYKEASPLQVLENGTPLTPHDRRTGCVGGFAHPPNALLLKPSEPGAEGRTYTLSYDPDPESEVTIRGGRTQRISWVYPGTSVTWTFPEPLRDGPHDLYADVVAFGGSAPARYETGDGSADIAAAGLDQRPRLSGRPDPGAWTVTVRSPEDGPTVLVHGFDARPVGSGTAAAPEPVAEAPALQGTSVPLEASEAGFVQLGPKGSVARLEAAQADGKPVIRLAVPESEAGPRMCTPWGPATGDLTVEAELRVRDLVAGDAPWKTARIEDAWRDDSGAPTLVDGKPAMNVHLLGSIPSWEVRTWAFPRPRGATQARICIRLPFASGTVEIAEMVIGG